MNLNDIKLTFDHSVQEVEILLAGLRKLPMEVAMDLYNKLHLSANQQVTEQTQAAEASAPETPAETPNVSA
jgi:hypothetical protein